MPFANANVTFLENFHITLADTSSTSASQYFISTDGVLNSRARVLGGGTSINAGFYTRASTRYVFFSFFSFYGCTHVASMLLFFVGYDL